MVSISFKSNVKQWQRGMTRIQRRQLPFATALALTRTAKHVEAVDKRIMRRVFDRPKTYTLRSIAVRPARKDTLIAEVFFREFAGKGIAGGKYLQPQVFGGTRRAKRSEVALRRMGIMAPDEYWVPSRSTRLSVSGNIPAGLMNKILSQLQAQGDPTSNETTRSRARNAVRDRGRGARFFVPPPGSKLPRGVWERRGRKIKPVLIFVKRPTYRVRFPMFRINEKTAAKRFPMEFKRAMAQALKTAK